MFEYLQNIGTILDPVTKFLFILYILVFLYTISGLIYFNDKLYAENYNSLFELSKKYNKHFRYSLLALITISLLTKNYYLLTALFFLLLYDSLFVAYILPIIKKITLKIDIEDRVVDKDFLFITPPIN